MCISESSEKQGLREAASVLGMAGPLPSRHVFLRFSLGGELEIRPETSVGTAWMKGRLGSGHLSNSVSDFVYTFLQ